MSTVRDTPLLVALLCSGCAALGYEIVWTRLCTPMLGSETLGVLATLAGFFGGMALGAALLHRRATHSDDPIGLFVRLELGAAAFAVVSPHLLHALGRTIPAWLGPWAGDNHSSSALVVAIAVAGVLMIPGTFCMGATLAAVTEARRRACVGDDDGRGIGRLYAANTAGAVVGVLVTVHAIVPSFGLGWGSLVLATMGVLAAARARSWGRAHPQTRTRVEAEAAPELDVSRDPDPDARETLPLFVLITGAGLVGVGLEVIGVLVLSQLFENTIYTFANVLAVYLAGTAIGAWLWGSRGPALARGRPATAAAALLVALALSVVIAAFAVRSAPDIMNAIAPAGAAFTMHLVAEAVIAVAVFLLPTLLMGALFSHAMGLVAPAGIGRAYALNTLGGAIAPFVAGVVLPQALGYRDAFYSAAWGYLLVFGVFTWFRRFRAVHQLTAIVGVLIATAIGPRSLRLAEPDPNTKIIAEHETPMGLVVVAELTKPDPRLPPALAKIPARRLKIGRHFRMGGGLAYSERRLGALPLLLHGTPTSALFLGVGTGSTLSAVTSFDSLTTIDAVELVPAVLDELDEFDRINKKVRNDERITFHASDARRFVAAADREWDVVVADLFHPGLDGAGSLYAREHFTAIREHLADGGLFAQWLPIYQLEPAVLHSIITSFMQVYPDGEAWLGIFNAETPALALISRGGLPAPAFDTVLMMKTIARLTRDEMAITDIRDVLASRMLDSDGLLELSAGAPPNTDLNPIVMLAAPHVAYGDDRTIGAVNLRQLLALRVPIPIDRLALEEPRRSEAHSQVLRFGDALAHVLTGDAALVEAGGQPSEVAIDEWLRAYAIAPDFPLSYPLLYPAAASSPELAERILPAMLEVTPDHKDLWRLWLTYLHRIGDEERLAAAQAEAEARFGSASSNPPE
ncbi:MAG TPA: hypothetical protein VG755_07645 [Nannocystaceae bacterium]|nr:hypothetical protein [Nannocystaceae bacterium]